MEDARLGDAQLKGRRVLVPQGDAVATYVADGPGPDGVVTCFADGGEESCHGVTGLPERDVVRRGRTGQAGLGLFRVRVDGRTTADEIAVAPDVVYPPHGRPELVLP